ncbi:hypothetical protein I307_03605 [Cryptococcus deuterogattii 99/473]|uniref:Uncharacterized protein n=1 Tax=Cryptococcus deuterogattii Ram5 TaxID=1296110 RepID=A0A0D0VA24_9TREE|nr:hypothetical protein I352_00155 [Cryptococcus deuterogattii MMRL2647]KIR43314.1 hypothetical protein I313_00156 [Cryptococcus deuterogattii Ram5]KIS01592.1 hypothetical protein L804_01470 [Cryptococcus deuterogattii 2001/935-1]KIY56868.1 hypothetical protein I307_03605 [Cryptococcus deuterogattii 99/473]
MLSITRHVQSSCRITSVFPNRFLSTSPSVSNSATKPQDVLRETERAGSSKKIETWFLPSPSSPAAKNAQEPEFTPPTAPPLPSNAPLAVHQFHGFITAPAPSEASEVVLPHTLEFFDTRSASAALEASAVPESLPQGWESAVKVSGLLGQNVRNVVNKEEVVLPEGDLIQGLEGSGPAWEWVGVVQALGMLANYPFLLKNPLSPSVEPVTIENPKTPRIDPDADWSIVPVKGTRICLNILTEKGRERWRLEDLWGARDHKL